MRLLSTLAFAATCADAATRVAVLEVGPVTGMVHRTEVKSNSPTTADGVVSFWSAVHGYGRKLQQSGMTVVPDLFRKPEAGLVVSVKNADLDRLPSLKALMSEDEQDNGVVGHMKIPVASNDQLLNKLTSVTEVSSLADVRAPSEAGLFGVKLTGDDLTDEQVAQMLSSLKWSTLSTVVHIVVEEEDSFARRRLEQEDEAAEEEDAEGNNNANDNNGFYGYGYYNAYNEWVTPYKTMFQIQYFNVVLWTSIGLFLILVFSVYLMIFMPLMSDTLLFGEAARMVGDD